MALTTLYHREIGFPAALPHPEPGARLTYSKHALAAAHDDHLTARDLPPRLPAMFELVEVTEFAGRVARWAVRFPFVHNVRGVQRSSGWDVVLAISFDYTVLSVWVNEQTDQHLTLRRERYSRP